MDINDPLSNLSVQDTKGTNENEEHDDIFKSAFKGSGGIMKITADNEDLSNNPSNAMPSKPTTIQTSSLEDQYESSKLCSELMSPDDDDLFTDCRSHISESLCNSTLDRTLDLDDDATTCGTAQPSTVTTPIPDSEEQACVQAQQSQHPDTNIKINGSWTVGATTNIFVEKLLLEPGEEFVTVRITDPQRVGEGLSSYMVYTIYTRTNLKCFRRDSFSSVRRYSDFLGLHDKLVAKYQHKGRIVPPPPEKSIIGATKVKMGSSETNPNPDSFNTKANFLSLRRAALERFINRIGHHPVLRLDADYIDFLESCGDLPRATSTSALSSASVMKMEESDPWYQEKTAHIEQMDNQLRKLLGIVESLVACRRDLAMSTGNLSVSLLSLANCEEAHHLSRNIEALARVEENIEQTLGEQADADTANLLQLVRDYLALINSVKEVLGERVKAFHSWQVAVNTLAKKREQRSRMELGGRIDRVGPLIQDVADWEQKVEESQENFKKISEVIKVEIELFQQYRVTDLKHFVVQYLEELSHTQLSMVRHWETLLPIVRRGV